MKHIRVTIAAILVVSISLTAQGTTVITKGKWTSPFPPASNNLILGMMPSNVVNDAANKEGAKTPRVLTDGGFLASASTNGYTIGPNAVIEYRLGDAVWGYDLTGVNFYTWWPNRDDIRIGEIAYKRVATENWVAIPGTAFDYNDNGQLFAKVTDSSGLIADLVDYVRITFGPTQDSGYAGHGELEITGAASPSVANVLPAPSFTIAEVKNGSTEFTGSNLVSAVNLIVPEGYDQYMVTTSRTPSSVVGGTWLSASPTPSELTFDRPPVDEDVTLYVWFTNSTDSVTLKMGKSQKFRYTTATPTISARTNYERGLPTGRTVVIEPLQLDIGSTAGSSSGTGITTLPMQIVWRSVTLISGPGTDIDTSEETVTLDTAGSYVLRLTVRNSAGNKSYADVPVTVSSIVGGTYVWTGDINNNWIDPLNWNGNATPSSGDNIVIPSALARYPLIDAGTYPSTGAYGTFTIEAGATVTCKGDPTAINPDSGGTPAVGATAAVPHGIGVTINCANAVINGTLSADYQGFPNRQGPAGNGEGASHGGVNYWGYEAYDSTIAYGKYQQPTALGSGGNGDYTGAASGGGAIKLNATGTTTINGLVTAKGWSRGAGGSIWLVSDTFSGTGQINADGDPGGQGGGGGRVAIEYTSSSFSGKVSVKGGDTGNSDGSEGTLWEPRRYVGKTGTPEAPVDMEITESFSYVFPDQTTHYWNLTVTNGSRVEFHGGNLEIGDLTVGGASTLRFDKWFSGSPDDMAGLTVSNLNVLGTGVLCLPSCVTVPSYSLATLNIETGAKVYSGWGDFSYVNADSGGTTAKKHGRGVVIACDKDANIAGLLSAKGRGFGMSAGPTYSTEGNSYGGRTVYTLGYGNLTRPSALGAGRNNFGGGGAIKLVVPGTLTLGGILDSNPTDSRGAGGSIWIQAGTLTGAGTVTARGGMDGRPGAGGRIAIETMDRSGFSGLVAVTGRFGVHNDKSYPGTIYYASVNNLSAFAADGGAGISTTFAKQVSDGTIFPEYVANNTNFDVEDAIVVSRTFTEWNTAGERFKWLESCTKKSTGAAIDNTANYTMTGLSADTRFVVKDNGALLNSDAFKLSDATGALAFTVPLGSEVHEVEVRKWTPASTMMIVR